MVVEPTYIILGNIQHYEGLLRSPDTSVETRAIVRKLLIEARAALRLADDPAVPHG